MRDAIHEIRQSIDRIRHEHRITGLPPEMFDASDVARLLKMVVALTNAVENLVDEIERQQRELDRLSAEHGRH